MPDTEQKASKTTTYAIAGFGLLIVAVATYMNYGGGFHSHAAPAETVAPATSR